MKFYAVMFFYHWSKIMDEKLENSEEFILTKIIITNDTVQALDLYTNTPCPASQLIEANSKEELEVKIEEMKQNFKNSEWVNNLKEYL